MSDDPTTLPAVDRLLLEHAGDGRALLLDPSDELLTAAPDRFEAVSAWCDDVRRARACDAAGIPVLEKPEPADVALGRLPGGLDHLDWLASSLAAAGATCYVASSAVKHMTLRQNDVLARSYRDVHATRGLGKYRALVAADPLPREPVAMAQRTDPETGLTLCALGPVFAGARVDDGTRLLLTTADRWPTGNAVDVGCGNGTISAILSRLGKRVTSVDVSRTALAATAATLAANQLRQATTHWADGLATLPDSSADLVVTNPPFHVGRAKDSTPTLDLLADAPRVLRPGGELWLVFNSHLPYVAALRDGFRDVDVVARDRMFTVARAREPYFPDRVVPRLGGATNGSSGHGCLA